MDEKGQFLTSQETIDSYNLLNFRILLILIHEKRFLNTEWSFAFPVFRISGFAGKWRGSWSLGQHLGMTAKGFVITNCFRKECVMNRRKFSCFASVALVFAVVFSAFSAMAQVKTFTITSGPMGGDWYSIGGAAGEMAKQIFPGAIVTVTTGGALENVAKVSAAKADVGLTMAKLYGEALSASGVYEGKTKMENLRAIAFLANIPMSYFLVKEDYSVGSIQEIKEKGMPIRLLTSKKGSSPSVAAELMLEKYGITFDDIKTWGGSVSFVSYAEASNLIKDGHADAWVGPMVSAIVELTTTMKMKMLPIAPEILDKLRDQHNYVKILLPKDRYYFVHQDTPHMAEAVIMVVQKSLDDEVVYKFTKALSENKDRIRAIHKTYSQYDPAVAWRNLGGPMHPGAERYYKEIGCMK
jgi:uncharacterized protein